MSALTTREQRDLDVLEGVVRRGIATFIEVGRALAEIRDRGLYRQGYSTFEEYCHDKWLLSRTRAYRLIDAAAVVSPMGDIEPPSNERQARELVPLKQTPEKAADALTEARRRAESEGRTVTARDIKDAVDRRRHGLRVMGSSESDQWETPQDLFDELDAEFGFEVDVCASPGTEKCKRFYSPEDDGLAQRWAGVCWMNPPYGDEIGRWVAKARLSAERNGATVVCFVPARVDTAWWWNHCGYAEIRFLRGRLRFGNSENSAPFPSALVVFGRPANAASAHWERDVDFADHAQAELDRVRAKFGEVA